MSQMINKLWSDDQGALIAMEFLFVATILVIGIIAGLSSVRSAINAELTELANAILALSQGYTIQGITGCCSTVQGSEAIDTFGLIDGPTCTPNATTSVINVEACN